jgi:hypothetical protein
MIGTSRDPDARTGRIQKPVAGNGNFVLRRALREDAQSD